MCAVLIRSAVFEQIGLLPDSYFLGGEEADFAYRSNKHGFKVIYTPKSVCFHKTGYSTTQSDEYFYNRCRNRLLFIKRNYNKSTKLFCYFFYLFKNIGGRYIYYLIKNDENLVNNFKLSFIAFNHNLKESKIDRDHLKNAVNCINQRS